MLKAYSLFRKKSKPLSFLWEFFMLFLAVTMGFFVENLREQNIRNHREKEFVNSFKNDIRNDLTELEALINRRLQREDQIDSIINIFKNKEFQKYSNDLYFYSRYLPRPPVFWANNETLKQLENSGNLLLIRNQKVVDTLLGYNDNYIFIDNIRVREEYLVKRLFDQINIIFDPLVFDEMNVYDIEFIRPKGNPVVNISDTKALSTFLSNIHYVKTVNLAQLGWYKEHKRRGENILTYLNKQYPSE